MGLFSGIGNALGKATSFVGKGVKNAATFAKKNVGTIAAVAGTGLTIATGGLAAPLGAGIAGLGQLADSAINPNSSAPQEPTYAIDNQVSLTPTNVQNLTPYQTAPSATGAITSSLTKGNGTVQIGDWNLSKGVPNETNTTNSTLVKFGLLIGGAFAVKKLLFN